MAHLSVVDSRNETSHTSIVESAVNSSKCCYLNSLQISSFRKETAVCSLSIVLKCSGLVVSVEIARQVESIRVV